MEWILVPVGVLLILAGLLDVFFTVLHYDGFGFLSSRLYDNLFRVACLVTRPLPRNQRALGLSMAAPLMIPVTITTWIFLVSAGYAFIYYAGMYDGNFYFSNSGLEPSFVEALYLSGTTIATLGYGDVTPMDPLFQAVAVSEALIGFGILTLAISYVVGVYGVLQKLSVVSAGLYHQSHDTSDPIDLLVPHFPDGQHRGLETHLMDLHRGLVEIYEGIRLYPLIYYHHSRRAYRSFPFVFYMISVMAGALRWGLPEGHPGRQTPWLPALITGLETIATDIDRRFLSLPIEDSPEPVPFEVFRAARESDKEPTDHWLARFVHTESFMGEIVRLEEAPDPREAYDRYTRWLPFTYRNRAFFVALVDDLGYELDQMESGAGKRLF